MWYVNANENVAIYELTFSLFFAFFIAYNQKKKNCGHGFQFCVKIVQSYVVCINVLCLSIVTKLNLIVLKVVMTERDVILKFGMLSFVLEIESNN